MNTEDNFQPNIKGHAPASEGADDNGTAPPNQGGNSNSEREAGCCAPPCSPLLLSVKVYDTGLSEKELETVRSFIRLQHPEMDGPLLFPSKDSVPQDQKDSFEFCQAPNADEFREEHRQLYIRAKQYMGFLDNPTAANFESLSKEVQDLLRREGKIPSDSNFRANAQVLTSEERGL